MKRPILSFASLFAAATLHCNGAVVLQEWNFTEDGSGIASQDSEQGLAVQFFGSPDPTSFDGGLTVTRGDGSSGDRPLGITLNDATTSKLYISVTLASFDFSAGTSDQGLSVRVRNDAANSIGAQVDFVKQDANSRMRILGQAVGGIAIDAESSASSFTYGMTLDFVNDTYTYWIGSPSSGSETWVSRFANHTGTISNLGVTDLDAVQWSISNSTSGNQFVIDQIQISYDAIPEPTAALLGGLGFLALLRRRR